jgi:molecular chaperone DnaK
LGGEVKDILLLDVTPLTLAIETLGGVATPMIARNTTIPASKTEIFSTAADNQTQVEVNVTQGERPMSADNKSLGRFILDGIPPSPRGVPQIEVTFDIDASGILKVTAKDKATGKTQHITISGAVGLSDDEIKRMQEEAEHHKAEDQKKAENVVAKNQADAMVVAAEKALKDAGDKAPADIKEKVEEKIKKVKEVLAKEDASKEELEAATKDLSDTLSQVGQAMYGQGQQTTDDRQQTTKEPKNEETEEQKDGEDDEKGKKKKDKGEKVEEGQVVE